MFLVESLKCSLASFIVLLIVITLSLIVIHFLYNASMILDKKEFKFIKRNKKKIHKNIKQKKKRRRYLNI